MTSQSSIRGSLALLCLTLASMASTTSAQIEGEIQAATEVESSPIQTFFVPLPEDKLLFEIFDQINTKAKNPVTTLVSIAVSTDNTILYYDHWEDGYDTTLGSQSTTQVWGDGDSSNGCAPIVTNCNNANDKLSAGDVIVLENKVTSGHRSNPGSTLLYDGGDCIHSNLPLAVTRAAYPAGPGSLLAGAVEVIEQGNWGTEFVAPVGQDTTTGTDAFEFSAIAIMSGSDGNEIKKNGVVIDTLDKGEAKIIRVNQSDQIMASAPAQAHLITGDKGSTYELRWYALNPAEDWGNEYYAPVGDTPGSAKVTLYNNGNFPITVTVTTLTDTYDVTVPAMGHAFSKVIPDGTGARFRSTHNFFALSSTDTESDSGQIFDWGYPLMTREQLTNTALVGLGYGCTENSCDSKGERSVVWVTAVEDADIYVDYNNDGTVDDTFSIWALEGLTITDQDEDMSGAIIWATQEGSGMNGPPVDIAAAWGQKASLSGSNDYDAMDLGTVIIPFDAVRTDCVVELISDNDNDNAWSSGDEVLQTITVLNAGPAAIGAGTMVVDTLAGPYTIDISGARGGTTTVTLMYIIPEGEIVNEFCEQTPYEPPPSSSPSESPSAPPSASPSASPSKTPTGPPTATPSSSPSSPPTKAPTGMPSGTPSSPPTPCVCPSCDDEIEEPAIPIRNSARVTRELQDNGEYCICTCAPSASPSASPSETPTGPPTGTPSRSPSSPPTGTPTSMPSSPPSDGPTGTPSEPPSPTPSGTPSYTPTRPPNAAPSEEPSSPPTGTPTSSPSASPSKSPSGTPTGPPTPSPSDTPSATPSDHPTRPPNAAPSVEPSSPPTGTPTESTEPPTMMTEPPTEATAPPTESTPVPTMATPSPTEATAPPTESTAPPTESTAPPTESTAPPTKGTEPPTEGPDATPAPTEATAPPTEGTAPPTEATAPPTESTAPPTEGPDATPAPTEATAPPTEATAPPTEATAPPTESTPVPTMATAPPTEGTAPPTRATPGPTQETASPTSVTTPAPSPATPMPTEKTTTSPTEATASPTEATEGPTTSTPAPSPKEVTDPPSPSPRTPPPSDPPVKTPAPSPQGSSSGDPHFKTWTGEKYDYHGECDLVLVHNPDFAGGKGLRVHIRTTRVKYFSFIEKVAVQIGKDVVEFDNDVENFTINGKPPPPDIAGIKTRVGGFELRRDRKALSIRIEDGKTAFDRQSGNVAKIDLHTRKNGFPAVIVNAGHSSVFEGSLGLLGEWGTGRKLGRDGKKEFLDINGPEDDATDFALEWQVRANEPRLFKDRFRKPQFPLKCFAPAKQRQGGLGESSFRAEAEEACSHWAHDKEDCIFDVMATRDVLVAEEGHIDGHSTMIM